MFVGVWILALCFLVPSQALKFHFMDCPGNDNNLGVLRRCCSHHELPNDCECFDISDITAFTNTLYHKPQCPSDIHVTFTLYTRSDRNNGHRIRAGQSHVTHSNFVGSRKTHFVAHGFTDFGKAPWAIEMKNALLDEGDKNVILVDWSAGAKAPNYYQAVANTRTVGAMIGRLIYDFHTFAGASYNNFHLIGHSLGAQIMGYAGTEVYRLTGRKVGRITGLDPAGPAFESYHDYVKIDKADAQFVDILHTDAESLASSGFGMRYSVGHADFYPNGGQHQPGCPAETLGILSMVNFESEKNTGACSHSRALDFFTNSIRRCRWNSPTSGSTCTMGYHVSTSCRGDHYPTTTDQQGNLRKCWHDGHLVMGCECFDISGSSDYTNTLFHLPRCPSQIAVKIKIYTQGTRSGQSICVGPTHVKNTACRGNRKTYFITHGFTDSATFSWVSHMNIALLDNACFLSLLDKNVTHLDKADTNVITVDWKICAAGPNYLQAVANTRTVGAVIARLIQDLYTHAGAANNNYHLMGHSLGAHIMAYGLCRQRAHKNRQSYQTCYCSNG